MRIDENYSMVVTKDSVHLHFEQEGDLNENGKPMISKQDWYYPNVKMALKKYVNNKVTDCSDILDIIDTIEQAERNIDNLEMVKK